MEIFNYIGIPYADKGRDESGVDCWGLVRLYYKREFNIELPSYVADYPSADEIAEVAALIAGEKPKWEEVADEQERVGDVIILRVKGQPTHVGVVVAPGKMLHVMKHHDTAVEGYFTTIWKSRRVGFVRYKETA